MDKPVTFRWYQIVLVVCLPLLGGLGIVYALYMKPLQDWEDSLNATHGWKESRVLKVLGSPRTVIRKTDDRAKAFAGYVPIPTQPVTNKVLVFDHLNVRGYLFINREGIVEHVAFGGT